MDNGRWPAGDCVEKIIMFVSWVPEFGDVILMLGRIV